VIMLVHTCVQSERIFLGQLILYHFCGNFLGANSSIVVAIDVFCTLQFGKAAGVPNRGTKPHPCGICDTRYKAINGKGSSM